MPAANNSSTNRFDTGVFSYFEAELDCLPGSSSIEKERPVKPHIAREVKPIVDELLAAGIIRKADFQGNWLSNSHAVPKPSGDHHLAGKASAYILRQQGTDVNHSRLTLDLRSYVLQWGREENLNLEFLLSSYLGTDTR